MRETTKAILHGLDSNKIRGNDKKDGISIPRE
jgi:hypothetical protein